MWWADLPVPAKRQPALASGWPRIVLAALLLALLAVSLAGCGFRMRGPSPLPFDSIYTNISENSPFGSQLRRAIRASSPHTYFVDHPQEADVHLIQEANEQHRRELSIDAEGHVEEYELIQAFTFRLTDRAGRALTPSIFLRAQRDLPYDTEDSDARRQEMQAIFEDMQLAMISQVVRRISSPEVERDYRRYQAEDAADSSGSDHGEARQ